MFKTVLIVVMLLISSLFAVPYFLKNFFSSEFKKEDLKERIQTVNQTKETVEKKSPSFLNLHSFVQNEWIVFFKQHINEKFCVSIPDEPKIENLISPNEIFRLSCFDQGIEYSLQAKSFPRGMDKELFLAEYIKQLKDLVYIELFDHSRGETPFGSYLDLFYQEENLFFCRERIFITDQGIYQLMTKSPDRPEKSVEKFFSSFEILP
jgi:hypothetical protein